jgi:hypothetical protein
MKLENTNLNIFLQELDDYIIVFGAAAVSAFFFLPLPRNFNLLSLYQFSG